MSTRFRIDFHPYRLSPDEQAATRRHWRNYVVLALNNFHRSFVRESESRWMLFDIVRIKKRSLLSLISSLFSSLSFPLFFSHASAFINSYLWLWKTTAKVVANIAMLAFPRHRPPTGANTTENIEEQNDKTQRLGQWIPSSFRPHSRLFS